MSIEHSDIFPFYQVPVYVRARDMSHLLDLKKAGATDVVLENAEVTWKLVCVDREALSVWIL